MNWVVLALAIVALLAGYRWVYREFARGGFRPTEGIGPHRRPYIREVIRIFQNREDDAKRGPRG